MSYFIYKATCPIFNRTSQVMLLDLMEQSYHIVVCNACNGRIRKYCPKRHCVYCQILADNNAPNVTNDYDRAMKGI